MKHARLFTPLLLVFLLALSLSACGGTQAEEPVAVEPAEEEAAPVEEAAPEEEAAPVEEPAAAEEDAIELVLWIYDDGRLEVLQELGDAFEAEYGVGLSVELVDLTEIRNAMTLGAASGEGPDLIILPHDNLGPLVENGAAAPIDLGDKAANYLPNAIDGFTYDGQLYGVPLAVENIGFFRNVDLVPEAPTTWAEVADIGAALVDSGDVDSAIGFPDLTYNAYPVYTSYGGYIFGRDDSGSFTPDEIGMNNEGMAEGLTYIQGLIESGIVSENIDWEASHVLFETGRSAFIMTGPWALNRFNEAGVNYAISAFPAAEEGGEPGYPFLGVQGIVVNAFKDNVLLAQTFAVDFLATEEHYQMIYDAEARPSAWTSIFEAAADADTEGFNAAGINADPMPSIPAMGFVWDAWVNAGALVAQGELDPQAALDNAVDQILAQLE